MSTLLWNTVRRSRPRVGWRQAILALVFVLCPAMAATDTKMPLPGGLLFWAGLLGLLAGLWAGRGTPAHGARHALRLIGWLLIVLGFGALLAIAAGLALPPLGLITQDISAGLTWLLALVRRQASFGDMPLGRVWEFLAVSLPRFWRNLLNAPNDSQRGAQLLVATGGVVGTWIGALLLGWGLAKRHSVFGWGTPMLVALMFVAILNGGSGSMLLLGLALLLVLAIVAGFGQRELRWDRDGTDYSDELGNDVLAWGAIIAGGLIGLALLLPTSLSNPLADLLWRDVELPSGIAELEKNIPRPPQPSPKIDVGLSTLPQLELGQSLEQPPPSAVVLRVRLKAPLAPARWPRYWRARVFNIYNGRGWTTNAHVDSFDSAAPADGVIPGAILQDIEDLRGSQAILVGLPDILNISIPARSERLPDGSLAALTGSGSSQHYQVLSRPQELAAPPRLDAAPPDMSTYLALPRYYAPRVIDLAHVLAGNQPSQYEKALALETYLRDLPYSYQVQPLPGNGDAVEQFLFDMRQGYCTYYASAMAVMARSLGIPARVAIGYATGTYDPAAGAYIVRESDAHAWPELYINGQWLPFEPTPIRVLPARSVASAESVPEPAPAEEPRSTSGPLIWVAIFAAVALLTGLGFWMGRPRTRRAPTLAFEVQRQLERQGARAGIAWPTGATLNEYGALLAPKTGSDANALQEVVDLVGQARYSGQPLGGAAETRLRVMADRVWARLRRRP